MNLSYTALITACLVSWLFMYVSVSPRRSWASRRGQGLCALCLPSLVSDRMLDSYTFAELTSQPLMSGGGGEGGGIH